MNDTKSKSLSAWIITLLIVSLGFNGYLWYQGNKQQQQNTELQDEFFELEKVQTELDQDYQAALDRLEGLRGTNKALNTQIDKQKSELNAQKEKINNLIWVKRELGKAKDEIANLNVIAEESVKELNTLKIKYDAIAARAANLEKEKETLVQAVNQERILKEKLEEAKAVLVSQSASLEKSNTVLSTKVDMAEAIKINYMEFQGYEVKDNGDLKKKSKGKDIDLMRTCFRTETNLVTPSGDKTFYIRYISPLGQSLVIEDMGSGVLTNKLDGEQVRYTTSTTVEYNNEDTEACVDWRPSLQLPKGDYLVELYHNGFMVGKGDFKLK